MLLVETYVDKSNIEGLGLFAKQLIPKGTLIWEFTSDFDRVYATSYANRFTGLSRKFLDRYAYLEHSLYVLCVDDARFMNHSEKPNTLETDKGTVSFTDIQVGEEITCDYRSFDKGFNGKF